MWYWYSISIGLYFDGKKSGLLTRINNRNEEVQVENHTLIAYPDEKYIGFCTTDDGKGNTDDRIFKVSFYVYIKITYHHNERERKREREGERGKR